MLREDAQLAEKKLVALQHRSRAKIARGAIFYVDGRKKVTKRKYRKLLIIILWAVSVVGSGVHVWYTNQEQYNQEANASGVSNDLLLPGGMPVGIYLETDGVLVLGTENMEGKDGLFYEPAEYIVQKGDYIVGFNQKSIDSKDALIEEVKKIDQKEVVLTVRRDKENIDVKIKPVEVKDGEYKLGIWVRDDAQGLGTMTYMTMNSEFGALGHGIHDVNTDEIVEISEGILYKTHIRHVQKGRAGTPGGLEGVIVYNDYNILGDITKNTEAGIFGRIDNVETLFKEQDVVGICKKEDIKTGEATIRCTVDGKLEEYDVEINRL